MPKKPNFLKHVFLQKLNDLEHLKFFFVMCLSNFVSPLPPRAFHMCSPLGPPSGLPEGGTLGTAHVHCPGGGWVTQKLNFTLQKKISNVVNRSIFAKKHVSKNWVFWAILGKVFVFCSHIPPDGRLKHLATFIIAILLAAPPKPDPGRGRGRIKAGRGRTQTGRGRGMTGGIARARIFVLF